IPGEGKHHLRTPPPPADDIGYPTTSRVQLVQHILIAESLFPFEELLLVVQIVIPESADELGGDDVAGVLGHHPYDEAAISPQITVDEVVEVHLVLGEVLHLVHGHQPRLDVLPVVRQVEAGVEPHQKAADGGCRDEGEPEPDEDEDDLVEEVHRQRALDRVAVHVAEHADLEVAQRHPGEPLRRRPLFAHGHLLEDLDPVHVEVRVEEGVQHKELPYDVSYVYQFDD
ncbi:hypothetical protein LSH36_404g00022, partial [Paralvinella palmiformis]